MKAQRYQIDKVCSSDNGKLVWVTIDIKRGVIVGRFTCKDAALAWKRELNAKVKSK